MLIFLILSLCISVPIIDFYNIIAKRKIRNSIFAIISIVVIQLMSTLLIGFIETNFSVYQVLSYITSSGAVVVSLGFLFFGIMKNKAEYDWSNLRNDCIDKLKQNMILYIAIMLFIFISMFQTNRLEDTLFYFEISSSFRYDIFTSSYAYILPGSYYFYGAMSEGFISQWYYLFTPVSFFIILAGICHEHLIRVFTGKYKLLQVGSMIFFIMLFCLFSAPTMISGNLYISGCLLGMYLLCMKEKDFKTPALLLIVSQFFSSTGALLTCGLVASTFAYLLIYGNIKKILNLSPLYLTSFFSLPILMLSFVNKQFHTLEPVWRYLFVGLMIGSIAILIIVNLFIQKKKTSNKFVNFRLIDTFWFSGSFMKYFILFVSLASMLVITIYFQTIYFQPFVYSMIPFYLLMAILFPMMITNYIKQYNGNENLNMILLANMCAISFMIIFLWIFDIQNGSVWRVMMILPTIGIGESVISYIIIAAINIRMFIPYLTTIRIPLISRINLKKSHKNVVIGLSSATIAASFIPIAVVSVDPALSNYVYSTYHGNVAKNVNLFEVSDIDKMLSLSKITFNSNWTFAFDNFASAYSVIKERNNLSFDFYEQIFKNQNIDYVTTDGRNNPLGSLGFYKSRLISSAWKNPIIVNQTLDEFASFLDAYIISGKWASTIDVIYLSKYSEYYEFLNLKNSSINYDTTIFEDLTVITRTPDIMNKIRNQI